MRHVTLLAQGTHPNRELYKARRSLRIEVLEAFEDPGLCELKRVAYEERFAREGYTVYNKKRPARYKTRLGIGPRGVLQVQIVSAGKRVWAVKEVASVEEGERFLKEHTLEQIVCMTRRRIS